MSLPGYSRDRMASICNGKGTAVFAGTGVDVAAAVGGKVGSNVAVETGTSVNKGADVIGLLPQALTINEKMTSIDQKNSDFFIVKTFWVVGTNARF